MQHISFKTNTNKFSTVRSIWKTERRIGNIWMLSFSVFWDLTNKFSGENINKHFVVFLATQTIVFINLVRKFLKFLGTGFITLLNSIEFSINILVQINIFFFLLGNKLYRNSQFGSHHASEHTLWNWWFRTIHSNRTCPRFVG